MFSDYLSFLWSFLEQTNSFSLNASRLMFYLFKLQLIEHFRTANHSLTVIHFIFHSNRHFPKILIYSVKREFHSSHRLANTDSFHPHLHTKTIRSPTGGTCCNIIRIKLVKKVRDLLSLDAPLIKAQ
jgi:hypothetical protein